MVAGVQPLLLLQGRSSRRAWHGALGYAIAPTDRPGLNIPVQTRPDASVPAVVSWLNGSTSALRMPLRSSRGCPFPTISSLFGFQATPNSESRQAVPPNGQSAALNGERKPGFGRMDAAERHGRARTARLWRSDRLTYEVREPRSGARTARAGARPASANSRLCKQRSTNAQLSAFRPINQQPITHLRK
ncbi:hypothetical protein JOE09_000528 [Pantoea coffeiphila]|nr:hypothetical protein [Pantoea coffeiphila]